MFDVGFSELILIGIVALLVIGPERLPETIRYTTRWMRNIRRSFEQAKRDVEQELGVDAIKRELHNEEILKVLKDAEGDLQQTQQTFNDLPNAIRHTEIAENQTADKNNAHSHEEFALTSAPSAPKTP
jgi:sec-independent protein translocase protein TatB